VQQLRLKSNSLKLIFVSSKNKIKRCKNLLWQTLQRADFRAERVINSLKIQSEALEKLLKSVRLIQELIYGGECCVSRVRVLMAAAGGKRD
jgi:hypothetical protein